MRDVTVGERRDRGQRARGVGVVFVSDAKNKTCRAALECAAEQTFIQSMIICDTHIAVHAIYCCLHTERLYDLKSEGH